MPPFICEVCGETEASPDQKASTEVESLEILHVCERCMEDRRQTPQDPT